MNNVQTGPKELGIFILRLALGLMFLAHSLILKIGTFGIEGTVGFFESIGYPAALAYLVIAMEALGGLFLVLGVQARWVALILSPILLGAIPVHSAGWVFNAPDGGWEYPLYLFVLCIVQFLVGDGAYALKPSSPLPMAGNQKKMAN